MAPTGEGFRGLKRQLGRAFDLFDWRWFKLGREACPLCGGGWLVRIAPFAYGVRCARCRAGAVHMSVVAALGRAGVDPAACDAYELSTRGALHDYLAARAKTLATSEYLDGVPPGERRGGILCQDVEALTFADASFDLVTSTEVFEHVADDAAGFRELARVLRPGGLAAWTVPLYLDRDTQIRARRGPGGAVEHLLPAEYHGDALRGDGRVLVFRDYGRDITAAIEAAGFAESWIDEGSRGAFLGQGQPVVMGRR